MQREKSKMNVLFLCTGNSCRSQMAEGWAGALRGEDIEPYSAGVAPHRIDPRAVRVMAEAGVDISAQRPKHVAELAQVEFDLVVTVCDSAAENCPVFPAKTETIHVPFDDPPRLAAEVDGEEPKMEIYRRVRDRIRRFVEDLPDARITSKADNTV